MGRWRRGDGRPGRAAPRRVRVRGRGAAGRLPLPASSGDGDRGRWPNALGRETTIRPSGRRSVPVSFGYHPYFRLPGGRRAAWRLLLPRRRHVELDERGSRQPEHRGAGRGQPIGARTFDDLFELIGDRRLAIQHGTRRLTVHFGDGYPFAQVYAPPGSGFACLEPMTAPTTRSSPATTRPWPRRVVHGTVLDPPRAHPARDGLTAPASGWRRAPRRPRPSAWPTRRRRPRPRRRPSRSGRRRCGPVPGAPALGEVVPAPVDERLDAGAGAGHEPGVHAQPGREGDRPSSSWRCSPISAMAALRPIIAMMPLSW